MSEYSIQSSNLEPVSVPPRRKKSNKPGFFRRLFSKLIFLGLIASLVLNLMLFNSYQAYFSDGTEPIEKFHSGNELAESKVAVIKAHGTIMPSNTSKILARIKKAKEDQNVKGVILSIDSPGGLVSDSHEIYHRLVELREAKPIVVQMKSMAASGGYYIAMGAGPTGKVFAEPTTWTGSIGVIIPRMEFIGLADKIGVDSKPLKTGPLKDALNPFRELGDKERAVWDNILTQSFDRFLNVIADNREQLDYDAIKQLATGEVYTADDALKHKLIDEIGYLEDALKELFGQVGLDDKNVRVVTYASEPSLMEVLLGSARNSQPDAQWQLALESTVPRPMYCCSWLAGITSGHFSGSD